MVSKGPSGLAEDLGAILCRKPSLSEGERETFAGYFILPVHNGNNRRIEFLRISDP
jgi:hypothetical protein